jgi:dTMP kinase
LENQASLFPPQFISFEGIDGCGKSTLLEKFHQWLQEYGIRHIITREPGGTPLGDKIRDLLLDPKYSGMDHCAEVLLYTASRAQHAREVILPAMKKNTWVLADRYIDATLAYQGYGRDLEIEHLRRIQDWATGGLWPHRTILLDCDVSVAFRRIRTRREKPDRMEQEMNSFHERVRQGYLELARSEPERFFVVDASKAEEEVIQCVYSAFWRPLARRMGRCS